MPTLAPKSTASESVLLAADDLDRAGKEEFSEWDLTVAAYARDPARFGLRGYADKYPDHKRVYTEITTGKRSSPVLKGYMMKTRKNHYCLTGLGQTKAALLRNPQEPTRTEFQVRELAAKLNVTQMLVEGWIKAGNIKAVAFTPRDASGRCFALYSLAHAQPFADRYHAKKNRITKPSVSLV